MTRSTVIGRFKSSRQGGWEGEILTLTIQRQIRFVPNDDRATSNAPAFHVMVGWQHIGDAWENESRKDPNRHFLRVRIDDPLCPLNAMLFPDQDMATANLVVRLQKSATDGPSSRERRYG